MREDKRSIYASHSDVEGMMACVEYLIPIIDHNRAIPLVIAPATNDDERKKIRDHKKSLFRLLAVAIALDMGKSVHIDKAGLH